MACSNNNRDTDCFHDDGNKTRVEQQLCKMIWGRTVGGFFSDDTIANLLTITCVGRYSSHEYCEMHFAFL